MIGSEKMFMTRKMGSLVIGLCLFWLLIPTVFGAPGDTGTSGDYTWRELDDGSVVITGYNGLENDINIPTRLDGKDVSEIGDSVFSGKMFITSVDIPVGIKYIGNYAFAGCNSLTTIILPNSLKTIGEGAFIQCAMTEVLLPEGLEKIEGTAFNNCGLTHITLPSSLKSIDTYAFAACYSLEEVTILSNLTSVGDGMFESCVALTDVTFACDQLPINNSSFFNGCNELKNVEFTGDWTSIWNYAFAGKNKLETVTLPSTLRTIGEGAFIQCGMTEIILPESLETMEGTAFNNCALTHITLPGSLKSIGTNAFAACYSLEEVTILSNLTSVGDGIFSSCTALTDVEFACDQLPINNSSFFSGCSELKNVEFTGDWTSIWNYAFAGRFKLETVTLPSTLRIIGEGAFIQCAMTEIVLPEELEYIERTAFNSSGLKNVTLPSSLQSIDTYAFAACYSLSKVTIMSESTSFGSDIFVSTLVNTDGIYGFEGSTAQDYANINSHPFHNIYTISFDSQNGSSVVKNFGIIGQLINEPDTPELIGYTFEGWYPTPACDTQQVEFPYTVLGNYDMYAKWIPERMINPQTGESNN